MQGVIQQSALSPTDAVRTRLRVLTAVVGLCVLSGAAAGAPRGVTGSSNQAGRLFSVGSGRPLALAYSPSTRTDEAGVSLGKATSARHESLATAATIGRSAGGRHTGTAAGETAVVGVPLVATPFELGIPSRVLEAYQKAAATMGTVDPGCHLGWWELAAIGRIESGHAGGGRLTAQGVAVPPILGPLLDGAGFAAVTDTDSGRLDGDAVWDRAVGPMQFLPGTWASYGAGGDPQNVDDATLASGRYLCAGGGDLDNPAQLAAAVFGYNHSDAYVADVLAWASAYRRGTSTPVARTVPVVPGDGGVVLAAELRHGPESPAPFAAALVMPAPPGQRAKPAHTGSLTAPPGSSPTLLAPTGATADVPVSSSTTGSAQPESAQPESAHPQSAQPETPQPETAQPASAQPESAGPVPGQPESARPVSAPPEAAQPAAATPSPPEATATAHACEPAGAAGATTPLASEPAPVTGTPSADPSAVPATTTVTISVTVLDLVGTQASVSSASRVTAVDLSGVALRPPNGAILRVTGTLSGDGTGLKALSAATC